MRLRASDDALVFASLPLVERHSLNATDALVLAAALDFATTLTATRDVLVLVASDGRLLRAASAEGVAGFNPETDTQAQLDTFVSAV